MEGRTASKASPRLEVRRVFAAPRDRVFRAWTDVSSLRRWFAPEGLDLPEVEADPREGGAYRVHMRQPDGTSHHASGVYREVDPPNRLVFTWRWATDPADYETLVTVDFHQRDEGTEVVLTLEGFSEEKERDGHAEGWTSVLKRLDTVLGG
jgi:uncharacterized protein YndB with AHSA1/START domain